MLVELPKKKGTAPNFDLICAQDASTLLHKMKGTEVDLELPKFETRSKCELIPPALRKIGLSHAFFSDAADFSGLFTVDVKIGKVIQDAVIIVDEEGTEAAAATAVVMRCLSAAMNAPKYLDFHADHTFGYAVVHLPSATPLFAGMHNGV